MTAVGLLLFWVWLAGYGSFLQLPVAAGDALQCFTQLPGRPLSAAASAQCNVLLVAALKSMMVYPPLIFITGKLKAFLQHPLMASVYSRQLVHGRSMLLF